MIQRIQKQTKDKNAYDKSLGADIDKFIPTKESLKATKLFIALFFLAIIYGIIAKAGTNFVIVIMLILSLATGYAGGLKTDKIFKLIVKISISFPLSFSFFFCFLPFGFVDFLSLFC